MLIRIAILALPALLMVGAPVRAADLSTLGCVESKLDTTTIGAIAADVERNLNTTGQRGSFSTPVIDAVKKAAAACMAENAWKPVATRPAILYTLAKLSLPVVQRVATERGFDPAALEALFFALPDEERNQRLTDDAYRRLAEAAIPEGDGRTPEAGALLHTFFEFESILQYASAEFAAA